MGLEAAFNFITDLNSANPAATDNVSVGDDHLRGIKAAIAGTFTNFAGIALTPTEAQINLACIPQLCGAWKLSEANFNDTSYTTIATYTSSVESGIGFVDLTGIMTINSAGTYMVEIGATLISPSGDLDFSWGVDKGTSGSPEADFLDEGIGIVDNTTETRMTMARPMVLAALDTLELTMKVSANNVDLKGITLNAVRIG